MKDADLYPVRVASVRLRAWDDSGATREESFELQAICETNLRHFALPFDPGDLRGHIRISGTITVENGAGKAHVIENHNYPGLAPTPLEVLRLESSLPYPREWLAGEMHCHSEFSSDPVEFGAPLPIMQEAGSVAGLDFVLCTDHSYDFYYRRDRYMDPCEPEENFSEYRSQVASLNASHPDKSLLIAGEEVSCGNHLGENVHMLVFGHPGFLPGQGDGGRRGLKNIPDMSIAEVLERIGDVPAFAAHPKARIGWLERKIFRRGAWHAQDLSPSGRSIRGLQFWNGNLGGDYRDGKAFWVQQLLRGGRFLPIGANDAHGDLNRNTGVRWPLLRLKQGRSHVFGRVRTVVPAAARDLPSLQAAFRAERCTCTDGPFAEVGREDGGLRVAAFSTPDYGAIVSVRLLGAETGEAEERIVAEWAFANGPMHFEERLNVPVKNGYVRLETVTLKGRRALTSAEFLP